MSVTRGQCDARLMVTFPKARHHRPVAGTKLYWLVTEKLCWQLAQGCTRQRGGQDSNPRPVHCKSSILTTRWPSHTVWVDGKSASFQNFIQPIWSQKTTRMALSGVKVSKMQICRAHRHDTSNALTSIEAQTSIEAAVPAKRLLWKRCRVEHSRCYGVCLSLTITLL